MRYFFILLLSLLAITATAQDCDKSPLFKKGAMLEYKTFSPKAGPFTGGKFFEITRQTFVVDDVKDSNNIKYSYITKTGVNPVNEQLRYEKKYIITCDGNKISIPLRLLYYRYHLFLQCLSSC